MRLVMPAEFIRLPAKMKNGTANNGNKIDATRHTVQDDEVRQLRDEMRIK